MSAAVAPSALVDGERLWQRHMALAAFGATPAGGVNRQALSAAEIDARRALAAWAGESGLSVLNDPAGNLFLRLEGSEPEAPAVLTGSHIDSQPTGGRFDGAFGVLAGLEALQAIAACGRRPRRAIETVAWMNEEGSRFAPGMMGSAAFTGERSLEEIRAVADEAGTTVGEALEAVLAAERGCARERPLGFPVHCFLEAHIEQGPLLEEEGLPIGVVSGIQGSRRFRVRVTGEAAHAGTTPRAKRRDALLAAVRMIAALEAEVCQSEEVMFTVGLLTVSPGAPSVVPREAYFSIDLRHPDNALLKRLGDAVAPLCEGLAPPCSVEVREIANAPSLDFPPALRARIRRHAEALGLPCRDIYSAAGHDARQLHYLCPTGMIFVPCRAGISHNEAEWAEAEHLAAAARLLADLLLELADDA